MDRRLDATILERHLSLAPLRGRRRGLVACIFHKDPLPSLSVDLARGLFHCFGCGAQGGLRRFAELVGERHGLAPIRRRQESPLQEARRSMARIAYREGQRLAEWEPWYITADFIRRSDRAVTEARAAAMALGAEHPRAWRLLEMAARVEATARAIEAELDDILASGRVA